MLQCNITKTISNILKIINIDFSMLQAQNVTKMLHCKIFIKPRMRLFCDSNKIKNLKELLLSGSKNYLYIV